MSNILDSALDMVRRDINYEAEEPDKDVWQTYAESIKGGGDCEDMCLAMRQVLLDKGFRDREMQLVGGTLKRWRHKGEAHMVLQVIYDAKSYVLDPLLRNPVRVTEYFNKYMDIFATLTRNGLYFYRNGEISTNPVCTRDEDPRWAGYQKQLKIERGEG